MDEKGRRIGLALSGGGYRAAAYHIGTLRALHKLGILDRVDVISSVSGGSIIAAYYMLHKQEGYEEFEKHFVNKLGKGVMTATFLWVAIVLLAFFVTYFLIPNCFQLYYIGIIIIALGYEWYYIFPLSRFVERGYKKFFFKNSTFGMLPDNPVLAINATDLTTGNLFPFSQGNAYCYPYDKANGYKPSFCTCSLHISKAVMASSCVPQFFTPITIDDEFNRNPSFCKRPLLVDGGLYDNQGAHKFEGFDSIFKVDCAIVSDAGQNYSPSFSYNVIGVLLSSIDAMMRRIKNFQRQHNNYVLTPKRVIYAYNDLGWDEHDTFIARFVKNIKDGYVPEYVYSLHGISHELAGQLGDKDKLQSDIAFRKCANLVAEHIKWTEILNMKPQNHEVAISVGTNLVGLSKNKIEALISHAEWMTNLQVRLHLPFLLKE